MHACQCHHATRECGRVPCHCCCEWLVAGVVLHYISGPRKFSLRALDMTLDDIMQVHGYEFYHVTAVTAAS